MKNVWLTFLIVLFLISCQDTYLIKAKIARFPKTFCNPVNLNYRFMKIEGGKGIREAADPVVASFKGKYYLFASKSSGYWYSKDFTDWKQVFIPDSVLSIEEYAPGLFIHKEYLYYVSSTHGKGMLYRSAVPETGEGEPVKEIWSYWDSAFYVEGDCLYMYYSCSPVDPIYAQVLDLNTLEAQTKVIACFNSNKEDYGWERTGEHNELSRRSYIEGAWMTAHHGKYYLQDVAPGTEWKSYADGTYVSDSPSGPFTYVENNPVFYKPTGFIGGAGPGCMFTVGIENYWKAVTNSISVRHMFERRISFYPAGFDKDDYLYTDTYHLSVRDLRIFGYGLGSKPLPVNNFRIKRDEDDPCKVSLTWKGVPDTQGYIIRYGIAEDKLYTNFQVMGDTSLEIGSLNQGVPYYFTVDAYNENGITRTEQVEICR